MNTKTSFFTYWTKRNRNIRSLYRSIGGLKRAHFDTKLDLLKKLEYRILKAQEVLAKLQTNYRNLAEAIQQQSVGLRRQVVYPAQIRRVEKNARKQRELIRELKERYSLESHALNEQVQMVLNQLRHTPHPQFVQFVSTQKIISPQSHDRQKTSPDLGIQL